MRSTRTINGVKVALNYRARSRVVLRPADTAMRDCMIDPDFALTEHLNAGLSSRLLDDSFPRSGAESTPTANRPVRTEE
jgi:hypothetical protein